MFRGRLQLSPSKNGGRGQHQRGSKKMPPQTRVLAVMGSTWTNQQANHQIMPTSSANSDLPQTPSKKRKRPVSATSTPRRKRVAPALKVCSSCPGTSTNDESTAPEMAGAFSLGEETTETDLIGCARCTHSALVRAPRLCLSY